MSSFNEDSMSSNCSSNNSFSSSLSNLSFMTNGIAKPGAASSMKHSQQDKETKEENSNAYFVHSNESQHFENASNPSSFPHEQEGLKRFKPKFKTKQTKTILEKLAHHNLMKHNHKLDVHNGTNSYNMTGNEPKMSRDSYLDDNMSHSSSYFTSNPIQAKSENKLNYSYDSSSSVLNNRKENVQDYQQQYKQSVYVDNQNDESNRSRKSHFSSSKTAHTIENVLPKKELLPEYNFSEMGAAAQSNEPKKATHFASFESNFQSENQTKIDKTFGSPAHSSTHKPHHHHNFVEQKVTDNNHKVLKSNQAQSLSKSLDESSRQFDFNSSILNSSKQKFKPGPLVIPSNISAFQQQQQQQQHQQQQQQPNPPPSFYQFPQPLLMHSQSMDLFHSHSQQILSNFYAQMAAHIYPNTTFLKSPRLFSNDLKKQYTPPPMLSPYRKGPGLFCNSKQFSSFFQIPSRPPPFNHSISCSMISAVNGFNTHNNSNSSFKSVESSMNVPMSTEIQQQLHYDFGQMNSADNKMAEYDCSINSESPAVLVINSSYLTKDGEEGTFFPEKKDLPDQAESAETSSNEILADLLDTDDLNKKPSVSLFKN